MDAGDLVGDDVMIGIVRERLTAPTRAAGSCSTGFRARWRRPRRSTGCIDGRGPLVVVDIVVPEDVLVRRLAARRICGNCGVNAAVEWTVGLRRSAAARSCTRATTAIEIVRERLKVYHRQTQPLVEFYSARPTFRSIDGNQPPDVVTAAIDAAIASVGAAAEERRCDRLQVAGGDRADARGEPAGRASARGARRRWWRRA